MYIFKREITKKYESEVTVVGGGVAGCAAAIAAARLGANTLLIEQSGVLGGQAGLGLVTPLSSDRSRSGIPFGGLINEICAEVIRLSSEYCIPKYNDSDSDLAMAGSRIAAPHILKYVLMKLCRENGVRILLHTSLIGADTSDNRIERLVVSEKSELAVVESRMFIDADGDGELLYFAKDDFMLGSEPGAWSSLAENGLDKVHFTDKTGYKPKSHPAMQPVSIFFTMGGVDYQKAASFNNKPLRYSDFGLSFEEFSKLPYAGSCGFEQICGDDRLPLPQGRILVSRGVRRDVAVINMSRVIGIDGSDADSINHGELLAQEQIINLVDFLKRFVPGFEKSYYLESASTLGVRESRRLVGKYVLSGNDVINCRRFDDAIARGSYMIDIHDPYGRSMAIGGEINGDFYEIPLRSLESATYDNLYAAGRCISSDHVAHSSTRIQGTCILTGQAAGTAAALSLQESKASSDAVRDHLIASGVWLEDN